MLATLGLSAGVLSILFSALRVVRPSIVEWIMRLNEWSDRRAKSIGLARANPAAELSLAKLLLPLILAMIGVGLIVNSVK